MSCALHLIDESTPADLLDPLALLAGQDDVIAFVGPPRGDLPFRAKVVVIRRPLGWALLSAPALREIAQPAERVHVWAPRLLALGVRVARRRAVPAVLSVPAAGTPQERAGLVAAARRHPLDVIVPTAAARAALIAAGLGQRAVHVLRPPAQAFGEAEARRRHARRELGLGERELLIVAPGEMIHAAGHKYACWVYAILRQVRSDIRLALTGRGPLLRHVRYFADSTGYGREMLFTGSRLDRGDVLAAADVAIFLPERDVGTSALAAAMRAGVPIAASATPDIAECAPDGEAALLCPPRQPRSASAAVLRLLEDAHLARRLSSAARQRAARLFDPLTCRQRLGEIHAALGRRPPASAPA